MIRTDHVRKPSDHCQNATLIESLAMIDRGMDDIKNGRTHDAKEALRKMAAKHGLKLDR